MKTNIDHRKDFWWNVRELFRRADGALQVDLVAGADTHAIPVKITAIGNDFLCAEHQTLKHTIYRLIPLEQVKEVIVIEEKI